MLHHCNSQCYTINITPGLTKTVHHHNPCHSPPSRAIIWSCNIAWFVYQVTIEFPRIWIPLLPCRRRHIPIIAHILYHRLLRIVRFYPTFSFSLLTFPSKQAIHNILPSRSLAHHLHAGKHPFPNYYYLVAISVVLFPRSSAVHRNESEKYDFLTSCSCSVAKSQHFFDCRWQSVRYEEQWSALTGCCNWSNVWLV